MKKIEIHIDEFNTLYKRLLLQPISFDVVETVDGCVVNINPEANKKDLVRHISDTVVELLLKDIVMDTFSLAGVYPEWTRHRLITNFTTDDVNGAWTKAISEDIGNYLNESIESGQPLKLSAYMEFGAVEVKRKIKEYAKKMEDVVFESIIMKTLNSYHWDDLIEHDVPTNGVVEVHNSGNNTYLITATNSNHKPALAISTSELPDDVFSIYSELIYHSDSQRYRDITLYTYILLMMKRWGVSEWLIPKSIYEPIEDYRRKLDIPVLINQSNE